MEAKNDWFLFLLQSTGVEFPEVTIAWQGEKFRCLGAGNRKKKIAFVGVKASLLNPFWQPFAKLSGALAWDTVQQLDDLGSQQRLFNSVYQFKYGCDGV